MGKENGCCSKLRAGSILAAILVRIVFTLHCLIAVWRILENNSWNFYFWFLLSGLGGLFLESLITLKVRKGAEYKWFCPSVFFYLATIVPCVWIMELNRLDERIMIRDNKTDINTTSHQVDPPPDIFNNSIFINLNKMKNYLPIDMESDQWTTMLEQMVQFILILGRWMLPKGNISRDELSQLLMVYIGISADIIEFFETFKEDMVKYNRTLIISILGVWSASLLQFCLVLTASKSTKNRAGFFNKQKPITDADLDEKPTRCNCSNCFCCSTEAFGILTTMFLQDAPFLCLRMLLLVKYNVRSYMHIFFTVKNSLVIIILIYRLIVVSREKKERRETIKRRATERAINRRRTPPNAEERHSVTDIPE